MPLSVARLSVSCATLLLLLAAGSCAPRSASDAGSLAAPANVPAPEAPYPAPDTTIRYHSAWTRKYYPTKIAEFRQHPLVRHDIVFLGNSITEQGGDWGQRLATPTVKNRGISGDVTEGVLKRLGEITYYQPRAVFLLIGINDLFNAESTPEQVADNILLIASTIHAGSPETKIYLQTILPTTTESMVHKISRTNELLKRKVPSTPFTLLDIHPLFADEKDLLKKELTNDGLHLTEAGYQLWAGWLKPYVR